MIRTINGDVERLPGFILAHEHLQIDLGQIKGPHVVIGSADIDDVINDVVDLKQFHFGAIVDVTALEIGRDPSALIRISRETGIEVICCTGFYWDSFSNEVIERSVESLADFMVSELTKGIKDSNVRSGVIKVGTKPGVIGSVEEKVFQAAVMAHKATGAPIITHTSEPSQALWQIDALTSFGADLTHVMIGHLDCAEESLLIEILNKGVFIGIDQISFTWKKTDEERANLVKFVCDHGFSRKVILSSDVARKTRLKRYGGNSYSTVFTEFVPLLRNLHLSPEIIEVILKDNPNELLTWTLI